VQRRCSYRRIRCSNQFISAKPSPSHRSPAPRHFTRSKLPLRRSSFASPIFLLQSCFCSPLLRVLCALISVNSVLSLCLCLCLCLSSLQPTPKACAICHPVSHPTRLTYQ